MANQKSGQWAWAGSVAVALIVSCSASGGGAERGGTGALPGAAGSGGGSTAGSPGSDAGIQIDLDAPVSKAPPCANSDLTGDLDGDGFSVAGGDCNDCSAEINPGAYDYPGNLVDEDCNGTLDDELTECDQQIVGLSSSDAMDAAKAIGLCRVANGSSWGVVSAKYVLADGSAGMDPRGHGLLTGFGEKVTPREGKRMLVLSSGTARQPGDPDYQDPGSSWLGTESATPPGFPISSPSCSNIMAELPTAYDSAALEVVLRAPTNAKGFRLDFDFYTEEFPNFICKQFNDFFVILQSPAPPGSQLGNIAFDDQGNPVSVNNGFLEVCEPQAAGGKKFDCALGPDALAGTGFEGTGADLDPKHAATGWLMTESAVEPGSEITLRFAIWDAGDFVLSSTVLVDHFEWDVQGGDVPITTPVPR